MKAGQPGSSEVYGAAFPVPFTPVYLADLTDGYYIASALSDHDGRFNLMNIPRGLYCIKVDYKGSTVFDEKCRLLVDEEVQNLDIKVIISDQRIINRVIINP